MAKKPQPCYVLELPLAADASDCRRLRALFEAGKRLHNVLLQEGLSIVEALRTDPGWAAARQLPKATPEQKAARTEAYRLVRMAHGFTEFSFQSRATHHKNAAGFDDRLGAHVTQKIGTRVFQALEAYVFGVPGRPRFKGLKRPLHSLEGKNNAAMLRWDADERFLVMERGWGIPVGRLRLDTDEWLWSALAGTVKFCRVLWRQVGPTRRYFVQIVMEGQAPMKASVVAHLAAPDAAAGMDIGPSSLAWCTDTDAGLMTFCANIERPAALVRQLQRKLDRQNRASNPDNFQPDGTCKKGARIWKKSGKQRQTQARLASAHAHAAACRENAHGHDINLLLSRARRILHDGVSVKSLQKNYGRSIAACAPGRFMTELTRKAERAGGSCKSVNVRQLKTSQYCHVSGQYQKKPLSQRWHVFPDGRGQVQRDVYSSFLALHSVPTPRTDASGIVDWTHDQGVLEAAWQALAPALREKKLLR